MDIRSKDGDVWSQQNIFTVDDEDKVADVDADFTHSSPENPICPIVNTYFEFIDFPEDTLAYLNDLFEQVKPSIQSIPLEK